MLQLFIYSYSTIKVHVRECQKNKMKVNSFWLLLAEISAKFTFGGFYQAICRREGNLSILKIFNYFSRLPRKVSRRLYTANK